MSFTDQTMTEPYTSREVSTVPGEGDANLLLQDSKAVAPYSTRKKLSVPVMILTSSRPIWQLTDEMQRHCSKSCRARMNGCFW